jgi:hypothetical protein
MMDTMLGGDFKVFVKGIGEPFIVSNGKVTSIPERGTICIILKSMEKRASFSRRFTLQRSFRWTEVSN